MFYRVKKTLDNLKNKSIKRLIDIIGSRLQKEYNITNEKPRIRNKLYVEKRVHLPFLLKRVGLNGQGVEIGVQSGYYSEEILAKSNLKVLYSVDPWAEFKNNAYEDLANVPQDEHNYRYLQTVMRLMKYGTRSVCIRMKSENAIKLFRNHTLDFVYIDANHSYEGCKLDINLWWPKVKRKGILAGHDYLDGKLADGNFGVKSAIDEFVKKNKLKLFVTKDEWPTWYFFKKT